MKRLIVNADDLGLTIGINRGILEAHERGIVTSASLMVGRSAARHGAEIARSTPSLSVGLHAVLDENDELVVTEKTCAEELGRQLNGFEQLVGDRPTHIDSHHHMHRDPRIHDLFVAFADRQGLPMRERAVSHCPDFYGEHAVGVESLLAVLDRLPEGDTELGCHPGYATDLDSRYTTERELELDTLTNPRVRVRLGDLGIELIGWRQL